MIINTSSHDALSKMRDDSKAEIKYDNSNAWQFVLSGCLVKHFNISGSEVEPSCKKDAGSTRLRITLGEVVRAVTISLRVCVAHSVV